jgi:uncharacterized protein with HEPN domain
MLRAAVERQFEIIGEAVSQLTSSAPSVARRIPDIAEIVAFRDLLIHDMQPRITARFGAPSRMTW